ncbi:hypothetical protein PYW07_016443 [Mythimna separata]|uniref:Reverse transcriptase domain-containing protein n=1 Tax=Mythimna separata TaxID=271217 RepID=A0AAD7YKH5_MYTSE|nr:hypothetical protein PYW07_016443 [Mythimna separata]
MAPPPAVPVADHTSDDEDDAPEVTEVELRAVVRRLSVKKTAPGPDGVPGRVWVMGLRGLFSACMERGQFLFRWKTRKLVLIAKPGHPADSPSAYRPIVLLDEVGKLFKRVIADRLVGHLAQVGPDLADGQFGFRRGRSTVDAIMRVRRRAPHHDGGCGDSGQGRLGGVTSPMPSNPFPGVASGRHLGTMRCPPTFVV